MPTYTTASGFTDSDGSMEITNGHAANYTGGILGTVKPQNVNGPGLRPTLRFIPDLQHSSCHNSRSDVDPIVGAVACPIHLLDALPIIPQYKIEAAS